jgi:hypothetical protein
MKKIAFASGVLVLSAFGVLTLASPPVGVTPTVIGRGTYSAFKLRTRPEAPVDVKLEAKHPLDVVVRTHDYAVDSSTGWHTHPGPVLITVVQGEVTFYEYDDQGYVDTGHGHIGRNESGQPARDVTVIFAPVALPFRGELDAPGPYCSF